MSDELTQGPDKPNRQPSGKPEVTPAGPLGWLVRSIEGVLLGMLGAVVTMMTNIISGLIKGMIPGGKATPPPESETEQESS